MRKPDVFAWCAVVVCLAVPAAAQQKKYTIAVASAKGIFVMTDSVKQLTNDANVIISERSWSPGGSRLLFYTFRRTKSDELLGYKYDIPFHFPIYAVDADGSNPVRLADVTVLPDASWSPDGKRIVFTSAYEEPPVVGVHVLDVATKKIKRIADRGMAATWSPDGARVLYVSGVTVNVVDADGTNAKSLARLGARVSSPVWSADGKQIAFVSNGWWTMNADGSQLTQRSRLATTAVRYSPDGTKILVVAQGASYVLDSNGSKSHGIQETRGRILDAAFSPDSRRVIYRVHVGLADAVMSVSTDGTDIRTLNDNIGEHTMIAVSPRVR